MGDHAPLLPLITCEHGGNRVPLRYRDWFRGAEEDLTSHRGWDPGALSLARAVAYPLGAPLRYSGTTRLLVDPNRSDESPELLSLWSRALPPGERRRAMRDHHSRHRGRVERTVRTLFRAGGCALHLGIHTFTPVWEGIPREVEVGILFDPERRAEAEVAAALMGAVSARLPHLAVHANLPYRGVDDGLTTTLRTRFPEEAYLGIEVEVSQALALDSAEGGRIARALVEAVSALRS